jgi:hypothetical protein
VDDTRFGEQVVLPLLRRLTASKSLRSVDSYESYTIVVADLKHRVEMTDEEPARNLPNAERSCKGTCDQLRLVPGVRVYNENECSHAPWDRIVQIYDEIVRVT